MRGLDVEILPPVEDMSPLDFLKGVYRNEKLPLHARLRAAADAAPFCHAKLAVHAQITRNDLAERLMRALEATQKVSNARLVQLIEHEPKADAGLPAEVQTILWSFHRSLAAASASADFERSALGLGFAGFYRGHKDGRGSAAFFSGGSKCLRGVSRHKRTI